MQKLRNLLGGRGGGPQKITLDYKGEGGRSRGSKKGLRNFWMVPYVAFSLVLFKSSPLNLSFCFSPRIVPHLLTALLQKIFQMQLSTTRMSWTTLHRNSTSLLWKRLLWWGPTLLEEQTSLIQVFLFQDFQLLEIFSSVQDTMESGCAMKQECLTIFIIQTWSTLTGSWLSANVQIFQILIQTIVNQMTRQALLSIPNNPLIIKTNQVSKWEYFTASVGFNLPADVALYKEFRCDADGKPDCEFDDCELSATSRYFIKSLMDIFLTGLLQLCPRLCRQRHIFPAGV